MGTLFENPLHLLLLIVVIVLLFGATKLGDVGGALGKSIREFKKEASKEDLKVGRVQVPPPTASYVPPLSQSYGNQPDVVEIVHRPEAAPSDYRPASPAQAPRPSAGGAPPDFPGR